MIVRNKPKPKLQARPVNRVDPTRTGTMRRAMEVKVRRGFARLKGAVIALVRGEDAFGLKPSKPVFNAFCPTGAGGGVDPSCGSVGEAVKMFIALKKGAVNPKLTGDKVSAAIDKHFGSLSAAQLKEVGKLAGRTLLGKSKKALVAEFKAMVNDLRQSAEKDRQISAMFQKPVGNSLVTNPFVSEAQRRACYAADDPDWDCKAWEEETPDKLPKKKKPTVNERFKFSTDPEKVKQFTTWLKQQIQQNITGKTERDLWETYIKQAYKDGQGKAFDKANKKELDKSLDFYAGSKQQFLNDSFNHPVSVERVQMLAERTFTDLVNVTEDMATKMGRSLVDGLIQGKGAVELSKDLAEDIDVSVARAETIVRTETIRAHNEGALTALDNLGVEEVGVAVEWSTAGVYCYTKEDRKIGGCVCPKCKHMEGVVLTIAEARGKIPLHPNCRCSWIPANLGEDDSGQKDTKGQIDKAFDRAGIDEEVDRDRPVSTILNTQLLDAAMRFEAALNVFCPTGSGGGVDPSCGKSDAEISVEKYGHTKDRPAAATYNDPHRKYLEYTVEEYLTEKEERHAKRYASQPRKLEQTYQPGVHTSDSTVIWRGGSEHAIIVGAEHGYSVMTSRGSAKIPKHLDDDEVRFRVRALLDMPTTKEERVKYGKPKDWKARDKAVINVFCPTGPGGGVDPSCGVGGKKDAVKKKDDFKKVLMRIDPVLGKAVNKKMHEQVRLNKAIKNGLAGDATARKAAELKDEIARLKKLGREKVNAEKAAGNPMARSTRINDPADPVPVQPEAKIVSIVRQKSELPRVSGDAESTLATEEVTSKNNLGGGINGSYIVTLKDGTKAVWKPADEESGGLRRGVPKGEYYKREAAAYSVAKVLKYDDLVPLTVERTIDGKVGSIQKFVPDAKVAHNVDDLYNGETDRVRAAVFDYLIGNTDRHSGNWMIAKGGKIKLIDHGLAFPTDGTRQFRSWIAANARALPIPQEVVSWNADSIRAALDKHGITGEAQKGVLSRLSRLQSRVGQSISSLPTRSEDWR